MSSRLATICTLKRKTLTSAVSSDSGKMQPLLMVDLHDARQHEPEHHDEHESYSQQHNQPFPSSELRSLHASAPNMKVSKVRAARCRPCCPHSTGERR